MLTHLLDVCKLYGTALRIGVNHGSLPAHIMEKFGDTPDGMCTAAMEYLNVCKTYGFKNVIVSIKSSNTRVMVQANRLLVQYMDKAGMTYPIHLGVTGLAADARTPEIGSRNHHLAQRRHRKHLPCFIDGAAGRRNPFWQVISTAPAPAPACCHGKRTGNHPSVGQIDCTSLLRLGTRFAGRYHRLDHPAHAFCGSSVCHKRVIDRIQYGPITGYAVRFYQTGIHFCPGCGRTLFDLEETVRAVKAATAHLKGCTIAVMGCIVNGPGEMADAQYGYVGEGRGKVTLYKGKNPVMRGIPQEEAVQRLLELIESDGACS